MEIAPMIFCMWYAKLPLPLQHLFGATACHQQIGEMLEFVNSSEYHIFTLIWNVSRSFEYKKVFTEDLAAILAGVHHALRQSPQTESRIFTSSLTLSIRRMLEITYIEEARDIDERRRVSEAAYVTIIQLHSSMVPRTVFGRRNNLMLSCAKAMAGIVPAAGWWAPYQD
jgi:hypothetical protein